jgi:hypothetical protein
MRRLCEEKICITDTAGYSSNAISVKTKVRKKTQAVNLTQGGVCKEMYIQT